jgi:hypothetical protein
MQPPINANGLDTEENPAMTRRKRKKERRLDSRLRPHLLRNEWNEFAPDGERRAKLSQELDRLAPGAPAIDDWRLIFEAAIRTGYSPRHARRLADVSWVREGTDE